jgi:hypothetical protein
MKKFLVVLLSLGLIAAFAATASAAATDVKFAGSYYLGGGYNNNPSLRDSDSAYSHAAFRQQVRIQPIFQIADGLTFTMRFDAMEKTWGNQTWLGAKVPNEGDTNSTKKQVVSAGSSVQENVEFEWGYVTFKTALGQFDVGYQNADGWGTSFSNASKSRPRISFTTALGPMTMGMVYEKWYEGTTVAEKVDNDADTYAVFGIYKWQGGEAGLLYKLYADASQKTTATPYKSLVSQVAPYARATFGPFFVEAEANYFFGKFAKYDDGVTPDIDADTLTAFIHGKLNMGPAYFGAQYAYASGGDDTNGLKIAAKQLLGMNTSYNATLIIGGGDALNLMGEMTKFGGVNGTTAWDDKKYNMVLYQVYGGFNPTPKLNLEAEVSYVTVAKKPAAYVSDAVGTEFGVRATYKIYDNLTYMVAGGYVWAGDYWKGTKDTNTVGNTYVVLNKLNLAF